MALETERSSPNGASSPGPNRDIHHHRPSSPHSRSASSTSSTAAPASSVASSGANDMSSPSPAITASLGMPTSSSPLSRFEPETAHGDTGGGEPPPPPPPASLISLCDALPFSHAPVYVPRLHPHPSPSASVSPCSPSASSSSSYYAGSPPLALYHVHHPHAQPPPPPISYHHPSAHHLSIPSFVPPSTSIVAPQAILAAGVALGGLALGTDATSTCGWADISPPRPLPHHQPHLLTHPHHPLLRFRPEDILSRPRHPQAPQPQQPPPPPPPPSLPFSVDNILRPAFGLRAVLEEEERGRRRFMGREGGRTATVPPQTPSLPPLPQLPPQKTTHKKKKAEVLSVAPKEVESAAGQLETTTPEKGASVEVVQGEEGESKASESKLPNPTGGSASSEPMLWPAWVYCTRYSDRPSSGPRSRRVKRKERTKGEPTTAEEKRPRTAFSAEQLSRLKQEFAESRYLTEKRRQALARDLRLNESQIKIWFQNKRAKIKKASGQKGGLALQLMAQGLYNHSTIPVDEDEEEEAAAAAAAAADEEKRRHAAASMVIPSVVVGGGPMPLDTRPQALLVER